MIIGGGLLQVPVIQTAKEMGLATIVTDYNKSAYGLKIADYPIIMSTRDIEGTVRVARAFNDHIAIDGVITVGTDASMTVAAVAGAINLSGIKFENALAATNKLKMRQRFEEHCVPSTGFMGCWTKEESFIAVKDLGLPVVVKPTTNMGARGVTRVNHKDNLEKAFNLAKQNSPSGEVIIEQYIEGYELSIDALIFNNKFYVSGIADRIIQYSPYFVEIGHIMPSNKPKQVIEEAIRVMKSGTKALGLDIGAAKGDIRVNSDGAKIIELAARLSGGFMSAYTYPYSTGVNLIKNAILIALGEEPKEMTPVLDNTSVEMAIIPEPGIVKSIYGVDNAKALKGVKNVFINVQEGDIVRTPTNNIEKSGHIISVAKTRDEALKIIEKALACIKIDTEKEGDISYNEIKRNALKNFNKTCFVCKVCDGRECKGQVPGMGGIGDASSFFNNIKALKRYNIIPSYVHDVAFPDLRTELFGYNLSFPLIIAPITGTKTNMGGLIDELDFVRAMTKGAQISGTIAMVGDGASPDKYLDGLSAIKDLRGRGIPIFKPRVNQEEIIKRIHEAEKVNAIAVGMDIDAAYFRTMKLKDQKVEPKSIHKIKNLVNSTKLPFILKGIMSRTDALRALDTGAKAIIVSNHGGRVMESMFGSVDVLGEIVDSVGKYMTIMVDGGFRSGVDIFKGLALGADIVCVGRPVVIGAYGGRERGVKFVLDQFKEELKKAMILTGVSTIKDFHRELLSQS